MAVVKCMFLLVIAVEIIVTINACNILVGRANNMIEVDPIVDEEFIQCKCNGDRLKVMEEMGFSSRSTEVINYKSQSLPFVLSKKKGEVMFSGRSPGMPQYEWLELNTEIEWENRNREVTLEVKQNEKQLTLTQNWTDPKTKEKKTATATYDFFTTEKQEKRMRMVITTDKHRAVCVYQVGDCPSGYTVD